MPSRAAVKGSKSRGHSLGQGREMLRRQAWSDAFSYLSTADREDALDPDDLVELAQTTQLIGKESESAELLARAHQGFLRRGDTQRAVRCAFGLGRVLLSFRERPSSD